MQNAIVSPSVITALVLKLTLISVVVYVVEEELVERSTTPGESCTFLPLRHAKALPIIKWTKAVIAETFLVGRRRYSDCGCYCLLTLSLQKREEICRPSTCCRRVVLVYFPPLEIVIRGLMSRDSDEHKMSANPAFVKLTECNTIYVQQINRF